MNKVYRKQLISENWTDTGNARRLIAVYGDSIKYCTSFKTWFIWDGKRWEPDCRDRITYLAKDTIRKLLDVAYELKKRATAPKDQKYADDLISWSIKSENAYRLHSMIKLAQSEAPIVVLPSELDSNPWYLNVLNGIVDLKTGKLLSHNRNHLITKLAPVEFDKKAACPQFTKFVSEVLPDRDIAEYVKKALGYSITGIIRQHLIFICYGIGRNGKGILLEQVLPKILGDYFHTARAELLLQKRNDAHPTAEAHLHGKRMIVCGETKSGARFDEAMLKRVTGKDRITARKLYQDEFTFEPTHKIWMHTNHKPIVYGREIALWDRLKVIEFPRVFKESEQKHGLEAELLKEGSGVLNFLIEGCLRWQREELLTPQSMRDSIDAYKTETDTLGSFIREKYGESQIEMPFSDLYSDYRVWASETGDRLLPGKLIGQLLRGRGFEVRSGTANKTMVRGSLDNRVNEVNQNSGSS